MPKIRYFIFDVGDVLVNVSLTRFLKEVTRAFGVSRLRILLNHDQQIVTDLMTGKMTIEDLHRSTCELYRKNITYEDYTNIWLNMLDGLKPDMIELAEQLQSYYQLVILSNIEKVHWKYLQENFPIFDKFSPQFLSYRIGVAKPDKRIYEHVLNEIKALPEECFFIDDRSENIKSARKIGIHSHRFRNRKRLERDLKKRGLI